MTKLVKIITLSINLSALILMIVEVVYFVKYINYAEATNSPQSTIFERYMRILGIISGTFYVLLTTLLIMAFVMLRRTIKQALTESGAKATL